MPLIVVFVDVVEVWIQRVVVEVQIGVGIRCPLPRVRNRQIIVSSTCGFGCLCPRFTCWWNRQRPVVAVVAQRAHQLFLRNNFEHARQIGDKPVLAGDRSRIAGRFVLVVIHQHDIVGVAGDLLKRLVVGSRRDSDKEPQVARMHLGIEFLDKRHVRRRMHHRQALKIQREAAIGRESFKETQNLLAQSRPVFCILQQIADPRVPVLCMEL